MYFLVDFENVRSNGLRGTDYLDKNDYLTLFFSSAARSCENRYLEAVGSAIEKMDNVQKHLPEKHRAGKIIFVITTDGLENSSEHFTHRQIRKKIEAKKECGWEFLFLGANIDAGREAEKIGIARNRSVTYKNPIHFSRF